MERNSSGLGGTDAKLLWTKAKWEGTSGKGKDNLLFQEAWLGASLVVQWLRLNTPSARGLGSVPGQGTRSHMPQLRIHMPQLKDLTYCIKDGRCCVLQIRPGATKEINVFIKEAEAAGCAQEER